MQIVGYWSLIHSYTQHIHMWHNSKLGYCWVCIVNKLAIFFCPLFSLHFNGSTQTAYSTAKKKKKWNNMWKWTATWTMNLLARETPELAVLFWLCISLHRICLCLFSSYFCSVRMSFVSSNWWFMLMLAKDTRTIGVCLEWLVIFETI